MKYSDFQKPAEFRKRKLIFLLLALVFIFFRNAAAFADVLGNESFENTIGSGVNQNWDSTNGAVRTTPGDGTYPGGFSNPPNGNFALLLTTTAQFTFQTYDNVKPGDLVTFSGKAESGVAGAANGGELRIEFKSVNEEAGTDALIRGFDLSPRISSTNAAAGSGFPTFSVSAVAPEGTERVVFVLRIQGANGNVLFDELNGEVNPAGFSVAPSKSHVRLGEPVAFLTKIQNDSGAVLNNVELEINSPAGFHIDKDSIQLYGAKPTVTRTADTLVIGLGNLDVSQLIRTGILVVPTSAVQPGRTYDFVFTLRNSATRVSEVRRVQIYVEGDPVFEEGTIIGKVFHDTNQNGVQDQGEVGVPRVKLVTEDGIVIITDHDGKYHVPGVRSGRHIVKIDGHSLPEGTKFITEESFLVRSTPGLLSKANFAVLLPPSEIPEEFSKDLSVSVTQGLDIGRPKLEVRMEPEILKVGLEVLEKDAVFRFTNNYPEFIQRWYLEVRDELGQEVWTGFGVSAPPAEVVWTGMTEDGRMIKPGIYSYQFKVEDRQQRQDWTTLRFLRVINKADASANENTVIEIPTVGDFNIFRDGKQNIPLVAKPTLRVQGKTLPGSQVMVNGFPAEVNSVNGQFETQLFINPGEKEIIVSATNPEGETTTFHKTVIVKDSMFFMVGLGEEQLGFNFVSGNSEVPGDEDQFRNGFYEDGRLSYYLVGKLKGKFLIKSHYDSANRDSTSKLFTNLDPEEYYPVYGDASTRDYEAQDSQDRFFFVVEVDRSFAKWGSFQTEFDDTELATYNRTLSGLKVHYEMLKTTTYGDPKAGVKAFWSTARQRPDHNELLATGGSLYYLRNRNVIQGSEQLRVEIRDKIQDIAVHSYDLKEGKDYEIDYREGRILLTRPLSSVAATDSLVSLDILDGSNVYLVADYEYDAGQDIAETSSRGLRGYWHFLGDHLRVGGTVVEDKRNTADYDMRAVDSTLKLGRNTKITAEYALTQQDQTAQAVSYDGGLSFAALSALSGRRTHPREDAYLIKGESKPVKNLEVAGYYQGVEPGFSTDRTRSQEGTKKYGFSSVYRVGLHGLLRYRFDHAGAVGQLIPFDLNNVTGAFEQSRTHLAQAAYDNGKWLAQAEYRRQTTEFPDVSNLQSSLLSEIPFENGLGGKFGYHVNEKLLTYAKVQTTVYEKANHQFGGGVRYEVAKDLFAYLEQMAGTIGDSTYFGFQKSHENGGQSYANLRMKDRGIGTKTLTTAIGSSTPLSDRSRVYSERQRSIFDGDEGYSNILGFQSQLNDNWDTEFRYERRHLDNATTRFLDSLAASSLMRTNTFNTIYGSVAYTDHNRWRARFSLEGRRDQDVPKLWQIVSRSFVEYQVNDDITHRTVLNYGVSQFRYDSQDYTDFAEFNTGFAYRPVAHDRFNAITRYTYLRNQSNNAQFETGLFLPGIGNVDDSAHVISLDLSYDVFRYFGIVEKVAYRRNFIGTDVSGNAALNSFLWANRLNFHVTRKWDLALEYRLLWQFNMAETLKHGALFEIDREIYDYVRLGAGYDFTDFNDDLTQLNDYRSHGPFVRMTGKF